MNDDRASASAPESDTRVLDIDPEETAEWLESLDAVVGVHGAARGEQLVRSLVDRAGLRDEDLQSSAGSSEIATLFTLLCVTAPPSRAFSVHSWFAPYELPPTACETCRRRRGRSSWPGAHL